MTINRSLVRYVFLDRDGVLNRKMPEGAYVSDWAQFQWLPGAVEAVARMNRAGMTVIWSAISAASHWAVFTDEQLELIHGNMRSHLARHGARLDAIYYCPHDNGECHCRKPDIGLFEQACKDFPQANAQQQRGHRRFAFRHPGRPAAGYENHLYQGEADRQKAGAAAAAESADAVAGSLLQAVELHLGLIG